MNRTRCVLRVVSSGSRKASVNPDATRNTKHEIDCMKNILIVAVLVSGMATFASGQPLYSNDFEKSEAGKLPDELMSLGGEFVVKSEGTNKFLELPGAPLETFGVQFGAVEKEN